MSGRGPVSVEKALEIVLGAVHSLPSEEVPLASALGRVLAEDVTSDVDLPPFDRAAMDGYAVRADDLRQVPCRLKVIEEVPAGKIATKAVGKAQCTRIMTGAPVPPGADAIIMQEHTRQLDGREVEVLQLARPGANICARGEDLRQGQRAMERGCVLQPSDMGLLGAIGRKSVRVARRPGVAVIATGSELSEAGAPLSEGHIYDANTPCLTALCLASGAEAREFRHVVDDPDALERQVSIALLHQEIVVISGGVSVGPYDWVGEVLRRVGATICLEKVAMKPGKPVVFATKDDRLIFGLPGNPVSSFVAFALFVAPAIRKAMGCSYVAPRELSARLKDSIENRSERRLYAPAQLAFRDGLCEATLVPTHGSADLVSLTRANALVVVPPETTLAHGQSAVVVPLNSL